MDEQRKLRNLLAYTKTDTIEELEDCNKLYEELLAYINKQEKEHELIGLYRHVYFHDKMMSEDEFYQTLYKIKALEGEMK